jgi:flagellar protein FliO/FliZ
MSSAWTFVDWLQYLLSFAFVIGLLLALLWTLRKLQNGAMLRKSTHRMHMLETLSVGPRQKIALIQIDGQEVLVGITAQQMTTLTPWPKSSPQAERQPEHPTP